MVEGAHQILDGVAGNQGNRLRNRVRATDVINRLSALQILLTADAIRVRSDEGAQLSIEISDVFFGPFDF